MTKPGGDIAAVLRLVRTFSDLGGEWIATSGAPPPLLLRRLAADTHWVTPKSAVGVAGTVATGWREILSTPAAVAKGPGLVVLAPGEMGPIGPDAVLVWSASHIPPMGFLPLGDSAPGVFLRADLARQARAAGPLMRERFLDTLDNSLDAGAGSIGPRFEALSTVWVGVDPMTCLAPGDLAGTRARMLMGAVSTPCVLHLAKPDRGYMPFEIVLTGRGPLPRASGAETVYRDRTVCLAGMCPANGTLSHVLRVDGPGWQVEQIRWRIDVPTTREQPDFADPLDRYGRDPFAEAVVA